MPLYVTLNYIAWLVKYLMTQFNFEYDAQIALMLHI